MRLNWWRHRDERQRQREERRIARFLLDGGWGTFVAPKADLPPDFVLPSSAPIPENPAVVVSDYGKDRHSR